MKLDPPLCLFDLDHVLHGHAHPLGGVPPLLGAAGGRGHVVAVLQQEEG